MWLQHEYPRAIAWSRNEVKLWISKDRASGNVWSCFKSASTIMRLQLRRLKLHTADHGPGCDRPSKPGRLAPSASLELPAVALADCFKHYNQRQSGGAAPEISLAASRAGHAPRCGFLGLSRPAMDAHIKIPLSSACLSRHGIPRLLMQGGLSVRRWPT